MLPTGRLGGKYTLWHLPQGQLVILVTLLEPEGFVAALSLLVLHTVGKLVLLLDLPEPEGLVALVLHKVGKLVSLLALLEPEGLVAALLLLVMHKAVHAMHPPLRVVHADVPIRGGIAVGVCGRCRLGCGHVLRPLPRG